MEREELVKSKEYILGNIQFALFKDIRDYLKNNKISRTDFGKSLNVSKGYISQLMNGEYDHKLSKLVELYLSIGKVPIIQTQDIEEYLENDRIESDRLELNPLTHIDFSQTEHRFDFELLSNVHEKAISLDKRERSYATEFAI